jgi:hypothetical protein
MIGRALTVFSKKKKHTRWNYGQGQSIALFECSDSRVYFMEALIITKPMGRVTGLSLPQMKKSY